MISVWLGTFLRTSEVFLEHWDEIAHDVWCIWIRFVNEDLWLSWWDYILNSVVYSKHIVHFMLSGRRDTIYWSIEIGLGSSSRFVILKFLLNHSKSQCVRSWSVQFWTLPSRGRSYSRWSKNLFCIRTGSTWCRFWQFCNTLLKWESDRHRRKIVPLAVLMSLHRSVFLVRAYEQIERQLSMSSDRVVV